MLLYVADNMVQMKDYLCSIDGQIGDGDHGIGIEAGFRAARQALEDIESATVNDVFSSAGMAMIASMGGASGIIFGSMFYAAFQGQPPLFQATADDLFSGFTRALLAIKKRGKADLGDKTMIDAFQPAIESLTCGETDLYHAMEVAAQAAKAGAERTKEYAAKHGRSQFLMDRSIGFPDAGAVSVSLIFAYMRDFLKLRDAERSSAK